MHTYIQCVLNVYIVAHRKGQSLQDHLVVLEILACQVEMDLKECRYMYMYTSTYVYTCTCFNCTRLHIRM